MIKAKKSCSGRVLFVHSHLKAILIYGEKMIWALKKKSSPKDMSIDFRERGRERGRERETSTSCLPWVPQPGMERGMCPDGGSDSQPFGAQDGAPSR